MSGSTIGDHFTITTWGESHGKAIGVVIDGCPSGLSLCEEDIQIYLNRRKPGNSKYSTPRKESDLVEILSGVFNGKTTGTPISLLIKNENQHSSDYNDIALYYRPGHADYTYDAKFGFRDHRGGGRSSARETAGRVAAGAVASLILKQLHIELITYTKSIGAITINYNRFDRDEIMTNLLCMPDAIAAKEATQYLDECIQQKKSSGGMIECIVKGLPVGIGEPVFNKLDAVLAKSIMSIGAVKSFEIGDGIAVAAATAPENNDVFMICDDVIAKATNHAGGILGGISDGSDLILRCAVKPTPSVSSLQKTITQSKDETEISIRGRHDPIIVPRAVVVVESMTAITLVDMIFSNMHSRMDAIEKFYL